MLYDATEAHRFIKPELMDDFKEAIAEAEREGKQITGVFVVSGVPVVYNIEGKP